MNSFLKIGIVLIATVLLLTGLRNRVEHELISIEIPKNWPNPHYDFQQNPLSEPIIELGRTLFYDPILSADNTISCSSCHLSFTAFTHVDHALSHGIGDSIGTRNAPVLINLAWNKHFMWDGAVNHIEMQALAPITHPLEMGENLEHVLSKLNHSSKYRSLFYLAFQDSNITSCSLLKSIAQFQLTLISSNSKYDKVQRNEDTFTDQEKSGYRLFKRHCNSCHSAPLFTTGEFRNNGLPIDSILHDLGRGKVTQLVQDNYTFKIPTLRNIEFSYPYMHDGRFKTLMDVLNHYSSGIAHTPNIDPLIKNGIRLSSNEKVDLIAFLLTLSDKDFLFNPKFQYPKP